jgi:hypothetical protein
MQRPGPLQELPLERFLPTCPSNFPSKSVRSHKRPLSPGCPNPYSPTKRRILNSEGVFAPEKTSKTPMSLGKASPARFGDVLASSASPARILDFGLPKNLGGEPAKCLFSTRTQIPSRKTLISSPELQYRRVSPVHHLSSGVIANAEVSSTSSTQPAAVPIIMSREPPPLPDPQSIHYPGFVVFQDAHITIHPADFNPERVSDTETHPDLPKENIPPRRKTLRQAAHETLKFEATPVRQSKSVTETPNRVVSLCLPMNFDTRKKLRRMMEEDDIKADDDE